MLHTDVQAHIQSVFGFPITVIHADDQLIISKHDGRLAEAIADLLIELSSKRDAIEFGSTHDGN